MKEFFINLAILSISTYLIRALPFAAMNKKIKSVFVRSFLHYIPFAVLAAMTLPAGLYATGNLTSGIAGLAVGGIFAYKGKGLTSVAIICCITAFALDALLMLFS